MARPVRIEFPNACYHITARGNARETIFRDDGDSESFVEILGRVVERYSLLCRAYCLMPNHYHLVVETPKANLSDGMRQLNGVYSQAFNRRHGRSGHVFQGRYGAILVERESHLLEVSRYVVLNPVRAKLCPHPGSWRWSSYRATVGEVEPAAFLAVDWLLEHFGHDRVSGAAGYRAFVAGGLRDGFPRRRGIFVGSETFVRGHLHALKHAREAPREDRQPLRPNLEAILKAGGEAGILVAYRDYRYRLGEIAAQLGVHPATVSRRLRKLEAGSQQACEQDVAPLGGDA